MHAYRLETVVPQNGELQLKSLPFDPGEAIEAIILASNSKQTQHNQFLLKNTVLRYNDLFEPVAIEDWNVLQ